MRLKFEEGYLDYDLQLFWDVVGPLDKKLQEFRDVDPEEADMMDYAETAEQLIGVALVVAQTFVVSVARYHGVSKEIVLDLGPTHKTGLSIVRIINGGAKALGRVELECARPARAAHTRCLPQAWHTRA